MKTDPTVGRIRRVPGPSVSIALLLLFHWSLETIAIQAADEGKGAKTDADARTKVEAKKPAVRVIVLKGPYADYPSAPDMDPVSMLLGGLEKPGSFFDLCEKIDELAGDDEIQHVLFDLSSPTLSMNIPQCAQPKTPSPASGFGCLR